MVTKTATPPGAAGAVAGAGAGGIPSGSGANGAAAGATAATGAGGPAGAGGSTGAGGATGATGASGATGAAETAPVLDSTSAVPPIPTATTQAAVSRMEMEPARTALAQVAAARGRPDLNDATRQRLEAEEQWLVQRLEDLTR